MEEVHDISRQLGVSFRRILWKMVLGRKELLICLFLLEFFFFKFK